MNRSATKARKRNEIVDRRRRLLLMLRSGVTQAGAAGALGVSEATISLDLAAVREQLSAQTRSDLVAFLGAELAALDADEADLRAMLTEAEGRQALALYDRIGAIQDRRARWAGFAHASEARAATAELDAILDEFHRERVAAEAAAAG